MRYYFIRHGESEGNVDRSAYHKYQDCDVPLTIKGKDQASEVGKELTRTILRNYRLNYLDGVNSEIAIYHTPFKRGIDTKNIIKEQLPDFLEVVREQECPLLHERQWGTLRDTIDTMDFQPDIHFNFFYRPDGGESFCDCYHRMATFFQMVKQNRDNADVVVIAHGEAIKCGLMYLLGWSVEEFNSYRNPRNCELLIVEHGNLITPLMKREKI